MAEISECLFKKQSGPKVCGHTENLIEITRKLEDSGKVKVSEMELRDHLNVKSWRL